MVKNNKINVELENQNLALLIKKIPKKLRTRVVGKALRTYLGRLGPDVIDLLTGDREDYYIADLESTDNDQDMSFDLDIEKLDSVYSDSDGERPSDTRTKDDSSEFNGILND